MSLCQYHAHYKGTEEHSRCLFSVALFTNIHLPYYIARLGFSCSQSESVHYKGYVEHSHSFALIFIFPTASLGISRPQALACGLEMPGLAVGNMLICNIQEIECYKKRSHVMIATRSIWFIRRWWSPMSTDNKCDVGLRLIAHCESGGKLWFSGAEGRHSVWPRRGTAQRHAAPSAQKLPPDYIR